MNAEEIKYEEVTTGVEGYSLKCQADFKFNQVQSFNWMFNGSFIHPSINKGLTVLTNGDLSFDSILPSHAGFTVLTLITISQLLLKEATVVMFS